MGANGSAVSEKDVLHLVNIEDLLINYRDLGQFFDSMAVKTKTLEPKPKTLMERLEEGKRKAAQQEKHTKKAKKREL